MSEKNPKIILTPNIKNSEKMGENPGKFTNKIPKIVEFIIKNWMQHIQNPTQNRENPEDF